MIVFATKTKDERLVSEWKDLTLEQAIEISAIELPETKDQFDWFQHLDTVKKIMALCSTFKDWDYIEPTAIVHLFCKHVLPIVQDLHTETPKTYIPVGIVGFSHEGFYYHLPTSLAIGQDVILQHGQTVKPFIEASNLMKAFSEMRSEGIKVMPFFVASIVKVHVEEEWSDAEIIRRAESFKTLPMSTFWEVFFCTLELIYKRQLNILNSMNPEPVKDRNLRQRLALRLGRLRSLRAELLEDLRK